MLPFLLEYMLSPVTYDFDIHKRDQDRDLVRFQFMGDIWFDQHCSAGPPLAIDASAHPHVTFECHEELDAMMLVLGCLDQLCPGPQKIMAADHNKAHGPASISSVLTRDAI